MCSSGDVTRSAIQKKNLRCALVAGYVQNASSVGYALSSLARITLYKSIDWSYSLLLMLRLEQATRAFISIFQSLKRQLSSCARDLKEFRLIFHRTYLDYSFDSIFLRCRVVRRLADGVSQLGWIGGSSLRRE